ncbi:MAG TPA: WecB/TagA/CpsF family glycosyltransferase [Sphingomonadaceae bacterium]|nr:WecB/TagA/CpsF family glycosyltransferase [Sphingomonadaceae bacterium]
MTPSRVEFLGLDFDDRPTAAVHAWLARRTAESDFAYVVTPNVDHMVRLQGAGESVWQLYRDADLCLCDSRILSRLARLCHVDLPVTTGSDLVATFFARIVKPGETICLIGGSAKMAEALGRRYPTLVIRHHEPPMGLLQDAAARARAVAFAAEAGARVTMLAVGSPQQELLAWEMARSDSVRGTALCIGAGVEFLLGTRSRAPEKMQRAGLEWAWRLVAEPRRMWRRYLVTGPAIFPATWRWQRARSRQAK